MIFKEANLNGWHAISIGIVSFTAIFLFFWYLNLKKSSIEIDAQNFIFKQTKFKLFKGAVEKRVTGTTSGVVTCTSNIVMY